MWCWIDCRKKEGELVSEIMQKYTDSEADEPCVH